MNLTYVPLLPVQRDLHSLPRNRERFERYLETVLTRDRQRVSLAPLLAMNPMGREHVTALLDSYLAMDADRIGAEAAAEAAAEFPDIAGEFRVALIIVDDLKGGWTNRFAQEYQYRFQGIPSNDLLPSWAQHAWISGVLWGSEPAAAETARAAVLAAVFRLAYVLQHGPARTLRDKLDQEGYVLTRAGCTISTLDDDELCYTRDVLAPFLDAEDLRTTIECLFGDAAAATLGFTPRGLSAWAGLALAVHEAETGAHNKAR